MKNKSIVIVPLLVLAVAYCLFRYTLFGLHGMKELVLVLAVVAIIISCISIFLKNNVVPNFTVIGYIIGFVAGLLFHSNGSDAGGGATNNLWLIWMVTMLCFILLGVIVTVIRAKYRKG